MLQRALARVIGAATARHLLQDQSSSVLFAFSRVVPPGLCGFARHESRGSNKGIEYAGIVSLCGNGAQPLVERIGVCPQQISWPGDADLAQIGRNGWADVGNTFQRSSSTSRRCFMNQMASPMSDA